ncbi:MAG TPA: hypothetical protein VK575_00765 [Gemmatimonadaceae bacterium]|jgi:hypothetical protein|nr:hypothetical protein [Gemmatimonadaceae bacterium]
MTMKRWAHPNELYPFWELDGTGYEFEIELTAEEFAEYEATMEKFYYWQKIIKERHEEKYIEWQRKNRPGGL